LIGANTLIAQPPEKQDNSTLWQTAKPFQLSDYNDWKKIDLKFFSFYVPSDTKKNKIQCIDSDCDVFENPKFRLTIDIGQSAFRPHKGVKNSSYKDKYVLIDGVTTWIWSYKTEESSSQYRSGIFIYCTEKNSQFNILINSENTNISELAENIFKSVQFKKDGVCKPSDRR
jgi:hypothetical protein